MQDLQEAEAEKQGIQAELGRLQSFAQEEQAGFSAQLVKLQVSSPVLVMSPSWNHAGPNKTAVETSSSW